MTGRRRETFATEDLIRLARRGLSQEEACEVLGVSVSAARARLKRHGLTWTLARELDLADGVAAMRAEAPGCTLAATGGRYADLSDWARARGLTYVQALQRWHRLRLAPQPRRGGV